MIQSNVHKFLLIVTASALFFTSSLAAPGDLDTTFNATGFAKTRLGDSSEQIGAAAIQTDGKIVVAGAAFNGSDNDFAVARYNPDGSLDTTFDTDGKVLTPIGAINDFANSIAIQSDGKIVVAGSSNNGSNDDFAVVRYNADGSLDTTFDTDGKLTTPIGASHDVAYSVAILADGKIVVAGSSRNGSLTNFAVVRYNADGSLDTTFGTTGKVTTSISASNNFPVSAAIQPDGKVVLAGNSSNGANFDFAVVRYNTDGSLDGSFDNDGKVTTPVGAGNEFAYSAAIQPDGKIVIAGSSNNGSNDDFTIVRYNSDGSLDTTFDADGKVTTQIGTGFDLARSVTIQSDGKIVAVGNYFNGVNSDFVVVRYNTNGSLDSSFDSDGKVTTPIQGSIDIGYSAAIQSDGKIVAAGLSDNGINNDFAVVRYNADGSLDTIFDTDGKVITREMGSNASLHAIAIQADGKIVAVGNAYNGTFDFAVVRYNTDGSLDTTFGIAGKVITPFSTTRDDSANSVAIQSDGKIVVAGFFAGTTLEFALVRYNADGNLDTTFGIDGKVTTPFTTHTNEGANSVAIQSDGKIVAAGSAFNGAYDFAIARYNNDGSLDITFDTDGKVTTPIGTGQDFARSLNIQSDGKIVVAGDSHTGSNRDFAVVRYNMNGSLDTTFDADGKVTTPIGTGNDLAYSAAIQTDGKIIAAGSSANTGSDNGFAVVRYNANGSLDNSFDTDGKVTTQIGTNNDYIVSAAIQFDGKIVTAGSTFIDSTTYDFAVVRYNTDGSLDTTSPFGTGGIVKTNIGKGDVPGSMAIQSDGKIVLGGRSDGQFAVVRYLAAAGIEGDAASRPNGDGLFQSNDVTQVQRFLIGLDLPYQGNEFQRADSAPFASRGNGLLESNDVVQAQRYQIGLDLRQDASGPTAPGGNKSSAEESVAQSVAVERDLKLSATAAASGSRDLTVQSVTSSAGQAVTVNILVDAFGDESGYGFQLNFNQAILTSPTTVIGTAGGSRLCNTTTTPGQITCSVNNFSTDRGGTTDQIGEIAEGNDQILVRVTFTIAAGASPGAVPVVISAVNASNDAAQSLTPITGTSGTVTILPPTAAQVAVSGRVVTAQSRGIRNVRVTMTDQSGNARTALTTAFGYFRFENVAAGETYIITARAKRFTFSQPFQVSNVNEDRDDINFFALPY